MRADQTVILMYHRILRNDPAAFGCPSCYHLRGTAVTPDEFKAHLDWLTQRQIQVLPLAAVMDACARHESPPPGVVLTFDDGYAEWLTLVAPELLTRRLSASYFVSSGVHAEMKRAHPIDEYYYLLDHASVPELRFTFPTGQRIVADLRVPEAKRSLVHGPLKHYLTRGTPLEQTRLLSSLSDALSVALPAKLPADLYLSHTAWPQLAQGGSSVEAHGHTHRRLTELRDSELDYELTESLAFLRTHHEAVRYFAYPDGAFDERVVSRVQSAGLSGAVTVVPGPVSSTSDRFRLPRYFVRNGTELDELLA